MIKNKKLLLIFSTVFLTIDAVLGYLLQAHQEKTDINIRFAAIVFGCLFLVLFAEKSLSYLFTQLALVCTVGADYFLVYIINESNPLTEKQQLPAMIFFSAAQLAYFLRLYFEDESKTRKIAHLITRAVLSVIAVAATFIVLGKNCNAVAVVSVFYYANLFLNFVFSCFLIKKNPLLPIGFLLFILCDTVIGLTLLKNFVTVSPDAFFYKILYPGFDLCWAFYLPSQALLAVSMLPGRFKRNKAD